MFGLKHRAVSAASRSAAASACPRLVDSVPAAPPPRRRTLAAALGLVLPVLASVQAGRAPDIEITYFTVLQGSVWVEWQGGTPPYRIQAATDEQFHWQDVSPFLFGNDYFGPTRGNYAFFRVRSESDTTPPLPPAGLAVSATRCDGVALTWQPASDGLNGSGVSEYRVYRDGMPLDSTYGADTFYLDRTVVPDTTYAYTVTAVDRMGNESASSAAILIATEPCVGESGPLTELTLEWDPSEERDVSGYLVYWGLRPGEYQWVLDTMADTVATVTELMPGNTYFFAVTAYDSDGTQSELSPEIAYIIP